MSRTQSTAPAALTIANFAAAVSPGSLPPEVLHEAKRSLLNYVGGAIGVAYAPVVETAVRVLEPFSGSGTQLIAAERHGRCCFALELSPAFVDVAVLRWQRATGKQATLDGDGRTFEEIAQERVDS